MKTKPKYFKTWLNCRDQEELDIRIADNKKRGFELVAVREKDQESHDWNDRNYGNNFSVGYKHAGASYRKVYMAEMRKLNEQYVSISE